MTRRLIIIAGWFAAAILAVLVGLVGISVIGDGLTSPVAEPISADEVARQLAAEPSAAPAVPSAVASVGPAPELTRLTETRGGTVVARCDAGRAVIVSMAPAQGWAVHERDAGPQTEAAGEFRGTAANHDRVKVDVRCDAGVPVLTARDERDD